jgi:hypothetical protein
MGESAKIEKKMQWGLRSFLQDTQPLGYLPRGVRNACKLRVYATKS